MVDLESVIEQRLIDQLCNGDSQWTYRPDIRTEDDLWKNFKYILEQNNKARLNGVPLSDSEFNKIKNDVSHATFYDAGKWLAGENGRVQVHIQRGNEAIHLVVMNNEHIAGGSSVYEVINQYQAFAQSETDRDRRFDVTLLINGIPLIHIELKNQNHSYVEGFNQIEKYINESKFRGLFSNVQMFVVSNAVDTKYFAAARGGDLNKKFMTGWIDEHNHPVMHYLDFAKTVLRIPEAHEMVAKYTVLDNEKKKLLLLRPYQVHAIQAMRNASKRGESGFIWHTTGSGKTMTSYKATRNLLMDIPSIDKTIFLLDRKDLDTQTGAAFESYAINDTIEVDKTEYVDSLLKKLTDGNRHMIVTTRQKLQILIGKRLVEGTKEYQKVKNLRIAFVVDECHRAVTPETKRKLETFFTRSLWYGFTGTPIFEENSYEQKGDLPQTTKQLYGECLHSYTIKEAIHDEAVLGFMVENHGPKDDVNDAVYDTKEHMRKVLDVILNRSYAKFGMQRGKGRTYEALLTVKSIAKAQEYYELLKDIKEGRDELKINDEVLKAIPDFPKFAITYSLSENEEASQVNQQKMQSSLDDYNRMFHTTYDISRIMAYNDNLNGRLARKEDKYNNRSEQLDLVIVVDRLLTGFDAPCLSTLYMDRQPMSPQNIIQAFSRTNRLYDAQKQYGQVVTFQSPNEFKKAINSALQLYSLGGTGEPLAESWEDVLQSFKISIKVIHAFGRTPEEIHQLSDAKKLNFLKEFRELDRNFAHLKAFTDYREEMLVELDFSEDQYVEYAALYKNIYDELYSFGPGPGPDPGPIIDNEDYELIAYHKLKIDFEYIVELLKGVVDVLTSENEEAKTNFEAMLQNIREEIDKYGQDNPKMCVLLHDLLNDIIENSEDYSKINILDVINERRLHEIETEVMQFAKKWYLSEEDVNYEVQHYKNGLLANENSLKDKADYATYKENEKDALTKLKFRKALIEEFKQALMPAVQPYM